MRKKEYEKDDFFRRKKHSPIGVIYEFEIDLFFKEYIPHPVSRTKYEDISCIILSVVLY